MGEAHKVSSDIPARKSVHQCPSMLAMISHTQDRMPHCMRLRTRPRKPTPRCPPGSCLCKFRVDFHNIPCNPCKYSGC